MNIKNLILLQNYYFYMCDCLQKAEAELAYELQAAKTKQRIKDEQMQIKVVERTQEILVQVRLGEVA